jgi:imidazolonepropionase-like amidohydrolase
MNLRRHRLGIALALSIALPVAAAQPLAIDNVQLIHTDSDTLQPARCVRITQGRIESLHAAGDPDCSAGAQHIDGDNGYLLPGLIDMHAHHTLGPLELKRQRGKAVMMAAADDAIAEHNGARLVAFGVTTIRNPGGDLAAAARYEQRRRDGSLIGPHSFNAGPVLNTAELPGLATRVTTPEQIRAAVTKQVEDGADWIKLYTGLDAELLAAGIEAAHAHGRPAVGHLDHVSWPDALELGLDGIVHLMPTSEDLLDETQRAAWQASARPGTFSFFEWWEHFDPEGPGADRLVASFERHRPVFDATLVAFHAAFVQDQDNPYKQDAARYAHPRLLANWQDWFTFALGWEENDFVRARAVWPKVQTLTRRLYASGARMTLGTDMSNPWIAPGISLHREMQLLSEAGVPRAQILRAATVNAADALGAGERLGRIAPGFEADLILLERNPLESIEHSRSLKAVLLDGRWFDSAALQSLKGE